MNLIEKVIHNNKMLCLIIRSKYKKEGIDFFTPGEYTQQLAYMNYPKDKNIPAHRHNKVKREVVYTQEVLFIKSGKVQIDIYSDEQRLVETKILCSGDVILLAQGGHGLKFIEQSEIIEVKQGPYTGDNDKVRFKTDE